MENDSHIKQTFSEEFQADILNNDLIKIKSMTKDPLNKIDEIRTYKQNYDKKDNNDSIVFNQSTLYHPYYVESKLKQNHIAVFGYSPSSKV